MYNKWFHNGDRREIFKVITEKFPIKKAIYPGSYIHVAPSFYIPEVVYIDSFKKTSKFFNDKNHLSIIKKNKIYEKDPIYRYYQADYKQMVEEEPGTFDLLISQYAGFISQCCIDYLKPGGILLANNSHGDASMASIDDRYEFNGVIYYSNKQFRYTTRNLEQYFIPKKKKIVITKDYLERTKKGIGYTKSASAYIFRKIGD